MCKSATTIGPAWIFFSSSVFFFHFRPAVLTILWKHFSSSSLIITSRCCWPILAPSVSNVKRSVLKTCHPAFHPLLLFIISLSAIPRPPWGLFLCAQKGSWAGRILAASCIISAGLIIYTNGGREEERGDKRTGEENKTGGGNGLRTAPAASSRESDERERPRKTCASSSCPAQLPPPPAPRGGT